MAKSGVVGRGVLIVIMMLPGMVSRPVRAGADANRPCASSTPERASLIVHASRKSSHPIPRHLTGKFCEHLYFNVTNGMDAQILKNPTFADYPFATGQMSPDGVATFYYSREDIAREIRGGAGRWGWPRSEIDGLIKSREQGVACWWTKLGSVEASPDTGSFGGRAQRVATREPGQGLAQWTYLPLHRIRRYEVALWVRAPDVNALTVAFSDATGRVHAQASIAPVTGAWRRFDVRLELPGDLPDDKSYKFAITADKPGQFVLGRVLLRPADHVNGADPDVIRFLKESHLPILRWPGGNFVSSYHWRDGVGPIEQRPTLPNYAWGQQENNFFGTDEFIAFCRAVGCEPMICVNAGNGTPEEAAQWIEYCNGAPETPMGKLRAAHGHPEPYRVQHWEVGNELWGDWQFYWTTAAGYVDRYRQFVRAMQAADPDVQLYACGAPVLSRKHWNDTLIAGAPDLLRSITDHPLVGGDVAADADPLDVYRDFMAVPEVLERKWAALRDDMQRGGIRAPRLAVTELQMFAHVGRPSSPDAPRRLHHDNLVHPATHAEGLYDVLIYHSAVRLAPFVEMVTHSATVNHGGGLRKSHERVWANPCHYAQTMFAALAEAVPVHTDLTCSTVRAPLVLGELRSTTKDWTYKTLDVLAAQARDGSLLLSIVHKGATDAVELGISLQDFQPADRAEVQTLVADVPWAQNTLEAPTRIAPIASDWKLSGATLTLTLRPYSYTLVRLPARASMR